MRRELRTLIFGAGLGCVLVSLAFMNVTLARGDYRGTLLWALSLAVAGDCCLAFACWRASRGWRWGAALVALPTVGVVLEFARRFFQTVR